MPVEISIKKNFGNFRLNIEYKGECRRIGILGASGSGKSLTLRSIAGIEVPDEGFIKIDGRVLFDSKSNVNIRPQKRKTGYMFQSLALFNNMSVEKNIKSGIKENADIKAKEIMEKFGLTDMSERFPHQLSQGQKQRTALARIIASEPNVILLDEPFSSLDYYIRDEMQTSLINTLKEFKGTVITVSHNHDEIYALCDELIVIDNGSVCTYGRTEDIFNDPPDRISAQLTGCKNIASAEYRGKNRIYVPDWGIELSAECENIDCVAIREHSFSIDDKGDTLCFDVLEPYVKKELFEYAVYFKPSEKAVKKMCFKISAHSWSPEKQNIPAKLYLQKKELLIFS